MNTKIKLFAISLLAISCFGISCSSQKKVQEIQSNVEKKISVLITTKYGDIKLALDNDTPLHRDNFAKLVKEGFYNDLIFHRVIENFMIQGGDPDSRNAEQGKLLGNGGLSHTIPAEIIPGKYHRKGALAAARTGDNINPQRASSASQFYIVQGKVFTESELDQMILQRGITLTAEQRKVYTSVGGAPWLDNQYTVFGEVLEGFNVIDSIAKVGTDRNNRPLEDIKMTIKIAEK